MAHARTQDPVTSHEAALAMEASGIAAAHRHRCLAAVTATPGLTAAEIAEAIGLERHEPSRRLPELRDQGLVSNGALRICRARGRRSLTWYPVGTEVRA